MAKRKKSS